MLREPQGARRYNDTVTLMLETATVDEFGHASVSAPEKVLECRAYVRQMSAAKAMMTFQQADVVGLDIELRHVSLPFNLIGWRGHMVHFAQPEDVGNRGRTMRIAGYYQKDDPQMREEVQNG